MKCISVRQPWASLIVKGYKDVENRTWPTSYRGPLLIHAGIANPKHGKAWWAIDRAIDALPHEAKAWAYLAWMALRCGQEPLGAIIGQVELVDCVQGHGSKWAEPGAWHWVLGKAKAFDKPVIYPGRQGLFEAPEPDENGLFKPHDGKTRRVCLTTEVPDVVICRPSKWGNPWRVRKDATLGCWVVEHPVRPDWYSISAMEDNQPAAVQRAIEKYAWWLPAQERLMAALPELKGKRIGCFCGPGEPCHGDVLVKLVEGLK